MSDIYIVPRCYWYNVYNDMQARVPTCEYYGEYGHCPCDYDCKHYISKQEADDIIRKRSSGRFESEVEE